MAEASAVVEETEVEAEAIAEAPVVALAATKKRNGSLSRSSAAL